MDANGCSESQMDTDDLPAACGEAWHIISSQLRLGTDGALDDGALFARIPSGGGVYSTMVNVTNNSGQPAQLVGWVDFGGDGNFTQPGDRSSPDLVGGSGDAADGTFTTGNIPNGTDSEVVVLQWTYSGTPPENTYARIRLTTDAAFFSDASPQPDGTFGPGETEGHSVPDPTLAVSLNYFQTEANGDAVDFAWQTASEQGVAGYHLYALDGTTPLNSALIPSPAIDSLTPITYRYTAQTDATVFYLDEIGVDSSLQRHGPFSLGEIYGAYAADPDEDDEVGTQMLFLPVVVR